jgi:hypothetical protein
VLWDPTEDAVAMERGECHASLLAQA